MFQFINMSRRLSTQKAITAITQWVELDNRDGDSSSDAVESEKSDTEVNEIDAASPSEVSDSESDSSSVASTGDYHHLYKM
jgi:hypothetical protein